jgi:NTP pyrophosphatase (non-canonical NTP hydrolase)
MKSNVYQTEAYSFAVYPGKEYPFLALSEEVGEVSGKLAKYVRKNQKTLTEALADGQVGSELHEGLKGELGGVLWNLSACCTELGITLSDLMVHNLNTLQGRKERGTIVGNGDVR